MYKLSLKDWVILVTIVPTAIISLTIAGYFSYNRYTELDTYLSDRAQSIIEPLAIASTDALMSKERDKLRHLIGFAHRSQSALIKSIIVFTKDNQVFVTSAYQGDTELMRIDPGEQIPTTTQSFSNDDYVIFRTPIINENSDSSLISNDSLPQVTVGYVAMQVHRNRIKFDQQNQTLNAFLIAALGILFSGIFSIVLIRNVTRPVTSMVHAVDRIREGKLDSRVSGQLIGELNFLKNGVNAMAESLGDYHNEMQQSVDQATLDLRESLEQFEIQNVQLNIAKRKAQEANKVKSEFLANMSHELRTPLNGVIGFTRQVLKTPLSETQRDYLQTIEGSAANLLAIINDILDFSKLDAGKMVIEKIPFSMQDTVEETITLLAPSAHKKNIEFSLRVDKNLPDSLIGDSMRIKQVIINLAANAIKFTEKGAVDIDIDCLETKNHVATLKVTVKDTGIGMNDDQKHSVFEAFGQADKSVTRLYGGTGLGLVISQRLACEMNGDIGFVSDENQGSTFWFTFKNDINPISHDNAIIPPTLSNKTVLYLEPHSHSQMGVSDILSDWNMSVVCASTIEQVNYLLSKNSHYDFALIGSEVTPKALISLKALIERLSKTIPSIHLAVNSNSPNLQEALIAAGASSCMSKPLTQKKLLKSFAPKNDKTIQTGGETTEHIVPIKVLAVDDNEANLKLIKALLVEQVAEVVVAINGQDAVELCKNEKFSLIFMDIQMPVLDGISALKQIKSETFNDQTPIIAVTAHALGEEKDKLLNVGFNSYMTKPIDDTMLKHTIYEYCDLNLLTKANTNEDAKLIGKKKDIPAMYTIDILQTSTVINWPLSLERGGGRPKLAKDMLSGLVDSLPENKLSISEALTSQDVELLKTLIHKLNGACCYTGVPDLSKMTHLLETQLKNGAAIDDLEPEFFEFFEHIDKVLELSSTAFEKIDELLIKINE